jgi:lambda family phage minor tail protein L
MAVPFAALQETNPGAVIELFELQLNVAQHGVNETYRFHAGANENEPGFLLLEDGDDLLLEDGSKIKLDQLDYFDVVWAGNPYTRFPLEADGFEYNGTGQLPRPTLRVSNLLGTITGLILTLPRGIEGAKVTRIRTLLRYLDAANFPGNVSPYSPDPTAEFPREVFYIDRKSVETRDVIEFELAAAFDLAGVRAPKRQCLSSFCQWKYRSTECGYNGTAYHDENDQPVATLALDVCGKRLDSCRLRFAQIVRAGTVTAASTSLVLDETTSVDIGAPVKGFGVPAGATIVSVAGNTITMSAAATATTNVTTTGTLQANRTQIIVTSATGLIVGMQVSGPSIATGTTIAAIAGTTITLGQAVDWNLIKGAAVTSKTGFLDSYDNYYGRGRTNNANLTGGVLGVNNLTSIAAGQFVIGPNLPSTINAKVVGLFNNSSSRFGSSTWVTLSYEGNVGSSSGTFSFYTIPAQSLQTYIFTAVNRNYTLRADSALPYGAFPGIGGYYT